MNIHTAPIEDQVRYVLFKLSDAGDAGVPLGGGYLPRDGAREVMRQKLAEAERGVLYILPKGHRWIRRNATAKRRGVMNDERAAKELVAVARELTGGSWENEYQDYVEEAVEDLLGIVRKIGGTRDARAAARFAPAVRKKLKTISGYVDLLEKGGR